MEAIRARHKGVPDARLRGEVYRAQKDVLFLYHLHSQANIRALMEHEAIQLRVIILVKETRALISEKHGLDQMRLARVDLDGRKHPRPGKVEKSARALYQEHLRTWPPQVDEVRGRISVFLAAAGMLSRRFFAGEDILFPDTRENLDWNLSTIANLSDTYADSLLDGSSESDDEFRDYVLGLLSDEEMPTKAMPAGLPIMPGAKDVACEAKLLAEQWILMARSETLERLGEHGQAEALADQLMREYVI